MRIDQKSLFDSATIEPPLARSTDASTSKDAASVQQKVASSQRERMLAVFQRFPQTYNEAARECVVQFGQFERDSYRKRGSQLKSAGLIKAVGERTCQVSGSRATVFEAVL